MQEEPKSEPVAAWAAVRHDGARRVGALPAGVRDNYMAEMAAQMAVAAEAGVLRVVIVFDATSPPEVLRRFIRSCRRRRQRIFRRDWLDEWWRALQSFESVAFVWQTSHVGAPVNEWADRVADGAAQSGLTEALPAMAAASYTSLEVLQADGQLVRGGVRAVVAEAAQREAVARLRAASGSAQQVERCDLELGRMPERLVEVAEAVLCGRAQVGDARRFCGRVARRMLQLEGCPLGCGRAGCRFAWHDVAFSCGGAALRGPREMWRAALEEARQVLAVRRPHGPLRRLMERVGSGGGVSLVHGEVAEVELRRMVGGAVLCSGEAKVDRDADVRKMVGRAVRAGLQLQEAGRTAAAAFEERVREETRRHKLALPRWRLWREAARRGGPARVAALRAAARARREAEEELARRELDGQVAGMEALGMWECLSTTCAESWRQARGVHVVSEACALRGWRWLALLRRWRWRAARQAAGAGGRRAAPSFTLARRWALTAARWGGPRAWEELVDEELRVGGVGARTEAEVADAAEREEAAEVEEVEADWSSLDGRAVAARRRWLDGGGRERLAWLRRWEVDEGREADVRGRWRVRRVVEVERPVGRRGVQLNVLLEWEGTDVAGSGGAWGVSWVPVTWCTADVKAEARRLEAVRYDTAEAAGTGRRAGARKSPRLEGLPAVAGLGDESEEEEEGTRGGEVQAAMAAAGAGGASEATEATEGEVEAGDERGDPIAAMLHAARRGKRRREAEDEAMRARVHDEVEELMDNGVRINPRLSAAMEAGEARRRAATAEDAAVAVVWRAPPRRCPHGHDMERCCEGGAGLQCDGGCGRALRRWAWRWSCESCDLDICEGCAADG